MIEESVVRYRVQQATHRTFLAALRPTISPAGRAASVTTCACSVQAPAPQRVQTATAADGDSQCMQFMVWFFLSSAVEGF